MGGSHLLLFKQGIFDLCRRRFEEKSFDGLKAGQSKGFRGVQWFPHGLGLYLVA